VGTREDSTAGGVPMVVVEPPAGTAVEMEKSVTKATETTELTKSADSHDPTEMEKLTSTEGEKPSS